MNKFKEGKLTLILENDNNTSILRWLGESNDMNPSDFLDPYFENIINKINKKIIIKFDQLKYMNSSTISPLIQFIKNLNDKSINIEIIYDKNQSWQRASFKAMESLSKLLKHLSINGI